MKKKSNNIIKFPSSISKIERKVEAILFAASEPLDLETIEKRLQNTTNIKKTLEKIQNDYKSRGSEAANNIASTFLSILETELGNFIMLFFFLFIYFFFIKIS